MINYLITDPKYYTNNQQILYITLKKVFDTKKVDFACFRDKENQNFKELAKSFKACCDKYNKKAILNSDYLLAKELDCYGVHLTSTQFDDITKAKDLGLFVIISTHNDIDIQNAIAKGADMITYSPIYHTPNKGTPKGIDELNRVCNLYNIDIIALGGIIDDIQIKEISNTNALGFASIRYFV